MPAHALTIAIVALALAGSQLQPAVEALSFWESQFSTSEFAQYRYKDLLTVTVFQHRVKNATFYITPLALLDHKSGVLKYNVLTEYYELRLKVLMWDSELQDSVKSFLTTTKGIARPEVKMLPMEKVRFDWRSRSRPLKRSIVMETEFITTHHLPMHLTLTFACKSRSTCQATHRHVRQHPEALDSLVVDCFLTTQKSATKTITVKMENLMQTKAFAKLTLLPPDGNYRYMRADDFNELAKETFSNVRASTVRSGEYVSRKDELNIVRLIQDSLRQDEVYSSSLDKSQWSSVFWEPAFARPDKVLKEASSTFTKNASTDRLQVNSTYLKSSQSAQRLFNSIDVGVGIEASVKLPKLLKETPANVDVGGELDVKTATTGSDDRSSRSSSQGSYSAGQLNEKLREANLNVQWEGERFVIRPMRLVRINALRFRSRRQLASRNVQLTAYQQAFSLKVIVRPTYNQTAWLFSGASSGGGFPTQFSYCLLSNGGACPPGFTRSSGHIKAINIDTHNSGMMKTAQLGDSAIRCHSPKNSNNCSFRGWEPYKGELHLHVCCR